MKKLDEAITELEVELSNRTAKLHKLRQERDDAKAKAQEANPKPDEGTIIATSNAEGDFEWVCNATSEHIIGHTTSTIKAAIQTFEENHKETLALALAVMRAIETELGK